MSRSDRPLSTRRTLLRTGAALLALAAGFLPSPTARAQDAPTRLPTLFLIGDSTVNTRTNGQLGWGDPLAGRVARDGGDYGKWAAEAARAGGVPFIDLNEIIAKHYEEAGQPKVAAEYFGPTDHTHTTPAGARFNAQSVVEGLRGLADCPLRDYLAPAPAEADAGSAASFG